MINVNTLGQRWTLVKPGVYPPGHLPEPITVNTIPTFEHFNQMYTKIACISYSTPGHLSGFTINQQGVVTFYGKHNYHIVTSRKQSGVKTVYDYNILPTKKFEAYNLNLNMPVSKSYGDFYSIVQDNNHHIDAKVLSVPGIDIIEFINKTPNLILSKHLPTNPTPDDFLSVINGKICLCKGFLYIDDNGGIYETPKIYNPYTFDPKKVNTSLRQIGKILINDNERISKIKLGWDTDIRLINGKYTFSGLYFNIDKESNPCLFNKQPLNSVPFINHNEGRLFLEKSLNYMDIFHSGLLYKTENTYPYFPLKYRSADTAIYPYTYLPRQSKLSWSNDGVEYDDKYQPNYAQSVDSITINIQRNESSKDSKLWRPIPEFIKEKYTPFKVDVNNTVYPPILIPGIYRQYYKRYINVKQYTPIITPIVGDIIFNYLDENTSEYEWTYEIPFYHWQLSENSIDVSHAITVAQQNKTTVTHVDDLHYNSRITIPDNYRLSKDVKITPKSIIYPETYYPAQLRADISYSDNYPCHPVNHIGQIDIYHEKYEGKYNPIVLTENTGITGGKLISRKGITISLAYLYCKISDVWMWVGLETGVNLDVVDVDGVWSYSFDPYDETGNIKSCIIPLGDMVSEKFITRLSKYTFPLRAYNNDGNQLMHDMGCIPSPLDIDVDGNIDIKIHLLDIANITCEVLYIGQGTTFKYDVEKGGYTLNGTLTFMRQNHYISIYGDNGVIPVFPIDIENIEKYQGMTVLDTIGIDSIDLSKPIYDWFDIV